MKIGGFFNNISTEPNNQVSGFSRNENSAKKSNHKSSNIDIISTKNFRENIESLKRIDDIDIAKLTAIKDELSKVEVTPEMLADVLINKLK